MKSPKALTLLALSSLSTLAHGAGFYLSEIGTPGSLGTAGVANPVNTAGADAAWANPAGMTGLESDQILLGSQVLMPTMRFDSGSGNEVAGSDGGNAGVTTPVPSFFVAKKLTDTLTGGFSIVGVMGGGADYGSDFVGRYGAIEVELMGVGISPSLGWQVNERLSVGAGISVLYTQFYQEVAVASPLPMGDDGRVEFDELDDWGYQPFFGLTYQINDKTLFGLVYRAEAEVELEGDLNFKNFAVAPPVDDVKLEWDNPQWLEIGLSYQFNDEWMGAINVGWQEWSTFSENVITIPASDGVPVILDRDWDDTWHAGVAITRRGENHQWSLGFSYESSPVSDSQRTIDFPVDEQYKFSGAYGWQINDKWDMALGATVILYGDGEVSQETSGGLVEGDFSTYMMVIAGATFRYHF
ncbi:MAG: OmpP1/FadL family transporter [Coraliomargarita sp.]